MPGLVAAVALVWALAGCGTRVGHQEVVAGAGAASVSLDPASVAALRSVTRQQRPPRSPTGPATVLPAHAPPPLSTPGSVQVHHSERTTVDATPAKRAAQTKALSPPTPAADATDDRCTAPGVPLRLGQVGLFSGVAGPVTAGGRVALAAWAQAVNARGGLACHPVVLYQDDDGGDASRAAAQVQDLVQDKHVQALVGILDPAGFKGIVSAAQHAGIPLIGGDGIDFAWTANPLLFPTGAGTPDLIRIMLQQTVSLGRTKGGMLYCVEVSACTDAAALVSAQAPKVGLDLVYSSPISVTQPDYTAQCLNARDAGVQVLGLAADGSTVGRIARSCAAINFHPLLLASALTFVPETSQDPEVRRDGVITAGAVAPWVAQDTPGLREYHDALARYAPDATTSGMSIQIWAAGKLLQATIADLGAKAWTVPITTADLLTGLGAVHHETLGGLTPPMTFTPGQQAAPPIRCAYFELLTDKGWTAPDGSKPICAST
jgi:branched-chain amino acid transport system substrate-binding protein